MRLNCKRQFSNKMFICTIFFVTLMFASRLYADETYKQFSLDAGSLNAAADKKVPAPGLVTANYSFEIAKDFLPYLGTGVAYSYKPDVKSGDIKNLRTGLATQLGFSYLISKKSMLKLDYKYLSLSPDPVRGDVRAIPQSLGIGLDVKF